MQTFSAQTGRPIVHAVFDDRTASVQYIVVDPGTRRCAIIDPVLDYDEKSGSVATRSADALLEIVDRDDLEVAFVLDTHPHADHLSAAAYLKSRTGAPIGIGEHVVKVQKLWRDIYGLDDLATDGSQWDLLLHDGACLLIGETLVQVLHSPGHTLASVTYLAGDAAFVHDTLLMPDFGTARCDFPGGCARDLWHSIQRILALPDETRLFVGHDYRPGGRDPAWETSVTEQRERNVHLRAAPDESAFVALRRGRDAGLPLPKLMLHALQVNLRAGALPPPDGSGRRCLKIPLEAFPDAAWD